METLRIESISTTTSAQVRFNAANGFAVTASYDKRSDGGFNRINVSVSCGTVTGNYNEHNGYESGLSLSTLNAAPEQVAQMQDIVKQALELIKAHETI